MGFGKTVYFVAVGVTLISSAVFAEETRFSISAENEPLGQVLDRIEKQSGLDVSLKDQKWAKEPVSFSTRNSGLEKTLHAALSRFDYVLEWHAIGKDFFKVIVAVRERKSNVFFSQSCSGNAECDDLSEGLVEALGDISIKEKSIDNKARLMNGLGVSESEYQKMVKEN